MIKHIEVLIRSKFQEPADLITAIKDFALGHERWEYLEPQSSEYASNTGSPSCALLLKNNKYYPAIAITHKENNTFYIANIVPKESGHIGVIEYNGIAKQFAKDLRKYIEQKEIKASINITSENISLSTIIPGIKSRELFQRYLNLFPLSYHPCDIERLDVFICHLSRYAKRTLDAEAMSYWLMSEKGWERKDAEWCVNRINIGLDVLKVNRNM